MRIKILSAIFLACMAFNASAGCSVDIRDENNYALSDDGNDVIEKDISKALSAKNYLVVNDSKEFKLTVNLLEMYNEGNFGPSTYGVQMYMKDSRGTVIAEGMKEAGIGRMLFAGNTIPRAMTKKAIREIVKQLPVCAQ